jgi:hypothetical protein
MMPKTIPTTRLTPNRRLEAIQKWSDVMKSVSSWNVRSIAGSVMAVIVLTTMIGVVGVLPAHSREHDRREERRDNDYRYENRGRGDGRGHYYNNGRRYYRAPVYRERVYVAPPVVYAPPRPPGISIFLPPLFF